LCAAGIIKINRLRSQGGKMCAYHIQVEHRLSCPPGDVMKASLVVLFQGDRKGSPLLYYEKTGSPLKQGKRHLPRPRTRQTCPYDKRYALRKSI
ncbi:MAG: hypothetical protein ACJ8BW_05765, partial [Ktedonobacteraceae bacterium]